ncbi:MAG: hypothetical protein AAF351_02405 [Pseudomonadota bacterium]
MAEFNGLGWLINGVLELFGIAVQTGASAQYCPECGDLMYRVKRKPPRKPYYMDYAHYCETCDHEVEAGHILPNSGRQNVDS